MVKPTPHPRTVAHLGNRGLSSLCVWVSVGPPRHKHSERTLGGVVCHLRLTSSFSNLCKRLNGESEIIYIGRAAAQKKGDRVTLRAALRRHVGKGSSSEQWSRLLWPGQQLIARVANTDDVCQARYWEKLRMRWFIEQHWELPAGNTNRFHPATPINSLELARECRKWREWAYRIC